MPQRRLAQPSDLVAASEADSETPKERHEKMLNNLRVLEHSIQAQVAVAQGFESNPAQYAQAIRFVEGLQDTYAELRLEAAVLDLQIALGGTLQAAGFIEQSIQLAREHVAAQQDPQMQTATQNAESVPPMVEPHAERNQPTEASGTSVAEDGSASEEDESSSPADEPEETVN